MTPTHDVVQKLLGAVKDEHKKAVGYFRQHVAANPGCPTCQLITQTEAQLAGGVAGNSTELIALANQRFADLSYKGFDERSFYNGFLEGADVRIKEASQKGALVAPDIAGDAEGPVRAVDASVVADSHENIRGDVSGLPSDSELSVSPANACIRAAKRVIAALNLPDGGGVVFDDEGWWICYQTPVLKKGDSDTPDWWDGNMDQLPDTAIPPWPGDFRTSFITMSMREVAE